MGDRDMKMGVPVKKTDRRYTYADHRKWPDEERWELISGVAWDMSPALSTSHQAVLGELMYRIQTYLKDTDCVLYVAPFDVLLPDADGQVDDEVPTVVQPDLSVICDQAKLTSRGCTGVSSRAVRQRVSLVVLECGRTWPAGSASERRPGCSGPGRG